MANMRYVTHNALRTRVARQRRRLLYIGLPALISGFWLSALLGLPIAAAFFLLWQRGERLLHGAIGEERLLGHPVTVPGSLAELPGHYILFNNLEVPTGDGGKRELDAVVLARNGLFVVEGKHLRGEISGSDTDKNWTQTKQARRSGKAYATAVRNPVSQVRSAAGVLHRFLSARGVEAWVQGIVAFTHPAVSLKVESKSLPVVTLPQLAATIEGFPPGRPPRQFLETLEALQSLQTGTPPEREPGPKHVSVFMRDFVTAGERLSGLTPRRRRRFRWSAVRLPAFRSTAHAIVPPVSQPPRRAPRRQLAQYRFADEVTIVQQRTTVVRRRRHLP